MADSISATIEERKVEVTVLTANFIQVNLLEPVILEGVAENTKHRLGDGSDHADVAANTAARHAESHTVASHSDTTATGAELEELTGGSETSLHSHAGGADGEWTDIGSPVIASAASFVTYQGLDNTYKEYRVKTFGVFSSSGTIKIEVEVASAWQQGATDYFYEHIKQRFASITGVQVSAANFVTAQEFPAAANTEPFFEFRIMNPSKTTNYKQLISVIKFAITATALSQVFAHGHWKGSKAAITGIRFFVAGLISGEFQLQGRN